MGKRDWTRFVGLRKLLGKCSSGLSKSCAAKRGWPGISTWRAPDAGNPGHTASLLSGLRKKHFRLLLFLFLLHAQPAPASGGDLRSRGNGRGEGDDGQDGGKKGRERKEEEKGGGGERESHIALPAWRSQLFLSQSGLSTHQMLSLPCPSPQVSAPEKGIIFIPLGCLLNPASRDDKKGKRLPHPQSPGETLGRGNWGLTPTLPLHLCLLRMCLPDILCPRFSPEGPECPARTEDSPRGEFCALQGQGAEKSFRSGRGPTALPGN